MSFEIKIFLYSCIDLIFSPGFLAPSSNFRNLSELLNISELFVADTVDQFATNVEEIDYPLAPQLVEVEQKLELNTAAGAIISTALNDPKSQWEYKDVEEVKLIHFSNRIYVPKTLRKRTLDWYHHYLCHPGGDRLAATLSQVCTWRGIVSQAQTHCKRCSACQKYKKKLATHDAQRTNKKKSELKVS
mgnify:CR=1 FL=1